MLDFFLPRRQFVWSQSLQDLQQLLQQKPTYIKTLDGGYEEQAQPMQVDTLNGSVLRFSVKTDAQFRLADFAATSIWLPQVILSLSGNNLYVRCGLRTVAWLLFLGSVLASVGILWVYVSITDRALAPLLSIPAGFFILVTLFFAYNFAATYRGNCDYVLQQVEETLKANPPAK